MDELWGYVYIILVTSYDSAERVVEGLGAGADDFITKPFDAAELVARTEGRRAGDRPRNPLLRHFRLG